MRRYLPFLLALALLTPLVARSDDEPAANNDPNPDAQPSLIDGLRQRQQAELEKREERRREQELREQERRQEREREKQERERRREERRQNDDNNDDAKPKRPPGWPPPLPGPRPTPTPGPTPTPRPTATPRPVPTLRPTPTPRPTPTNEELRERLERERRRRLQLERALQRELWYNDLREDSLRRSLIQAEEERRYLQSLNAQTEWQREEERRLWNETLERLQGDLQTTLDGMHSDREYWTAEQARWQTEQQQMQLRLDELTRKDAVRSEELSTIRAQNQELKQQNENLQDQYEILKLRSDETQSAHQMQQQLNARLLQRNRALEAQTRAQNALVSRLRSQLAKAAPRKASTRKASTQKLSARAGRPSQR